MSEQIHDQVSAFMDDELSGEECAFLVRRLERDPDARNKLVRYNLIGSTLRGELMQPDPSMLQRRVHDALTGVSPQVRTAAAVGAPEWRQRKWVNPAFGVGIAATVAMSALFTVRALNDGGIDTVGDSGLSQPLEAAMSARMPSYVVPSEPQDNRVVAPPPIRLTNYLMHHGEYASRLSRTSVHSNVVGALVAPAAIDAAAMEAAAAPDAQQPLERGAQ